MKILLANKFYYRRGGDCIYTMELERLLTAHGHTVAMFSMQHPQNESNPYSSYWPSTVEFGGRGKAKMLKAVARPFYSREVNRKFDALLRSFRPDVVHVNNIHSQLSPGIVLQAKRAGVPVVWTLHDYKLICANYTFHRSMAVCELCIKDHTAVVTKRCIKNSLAASILGYAEKALWNPGVLQRNTDLFICPSRFLMDKMIQAGFDAQKLTVLNNFLPDNKRSGPAGRGKPANTFVYLGRLSKEKGVETLLEAFRELPQAQLRVIGTGPEETSYRQHYSLPNVEFLGYRQWDEIKLLLQDARSFIIPSEWYENNPLSIMEAFGLGVPGIGSAIGGIPELIRDGYNGYVFTPGDVNDLRAKVRRMMDTDQWETMSDQARQSAARYSGETYYTSINTLYQSVLSDRKSSWI